MDQLPVTRDDLQYLKTVPTHLSCGLLVARVDAYNAGIHIQSTTSAPTGK
jgi:hypothetical protein